MDISPRGPRLAARESKKASPASASDLSIC
jgi:hypothetical protein